MPSKAYAEVILSKVTRQLDKVYHYSIPENLKHKVDVGRQVLVPFGRRSEVGYVVGLLDKTEVKGIKDILQVISPHSLFNEEIVKLAKWLADYYCSFFITALRSVMPPGLTRVEKRVREIKLPRKPYFESRKLKVVSRKLLKIGPAISPTEDQKKALDLIKKNLERGQFETILLYGITGSGKTEVYLQSIAYALSRGKSSIVLVPEIALTPQMIERFKERFSDHLSIFHSRLSIKERNKEWERLSLGEAEIVLGTRSAIFAPIKNL